MSEGARELTKKNLRVFVFYAAVLGFALGGSFVWLSPNYHVPYCPAYASGGNQCEERGTENQNLSAFYTASVWVRRNHNEVEAMGVVATALFTLALFVSTFMLWKVTGTAANAAVVAANIAEKTLTDADRPWVFVEQVIVKDRNISGAIYIPNNFLFAVKIKNVGKSPAFPLEACVKYSNMEDLPENPDYSKAVILGVRTTMAVGDDFETSLSGPAAFPLKSGETAPEKVAFGYVAYKDVHGRIHKTGFAYRVAPYGAFAIVYNGEGYEYYT